MRQSLERLAVPGLIGDNGTILATADGETTWTPQSSGIAERLFRVTFTDIRHGWAVGSEGTILSTTDGGTIWAAEASGVQRLLSVAYPDASHGWAVGGSGAIVAILLPNPPCGDH